MKKGLNMTLASKFVGMNIKKVSDQLASGSIVTTALEINDAKNASKVADMIKKSLNSSKGSVLVLVIKI
jgi:hypothetical protein